MLKFTTNHEGPERLDFYVNLEQRLGFHNAAVDTAPTMTRDEFGDAIATALRGNGGSTDNILLNLENNAGTKRGAPTDAPISEYRHAFDVRDLMTAKQFERVTELLMQIMTPYTVDGVELRALPYELEIRHYARNKTEVRAVGDIQTHDSWNTEVKTPTRPKAEVKAPKPAPKATPKLDALFTKLASF